MNISEEGFEKLHWKTKRIGKKAYTYKGIHINKPGVYPVFIKTEEYEERSDPILD